MLNEPSLCNSCNRGCTGAWTWPCMGFTWERAQELIRRYQNAISWCTETQPTASFLLFGFCVSIGSVFVVIQPFYLRNLEFVHFKGKQKNNIEALNFGLMPPSTACQLFPGLIEAPSWRPGPDSAAAQGRIFIVQTLFEYEHTKNNLEVICCRGTSSHHFKLMTSYVTQPKSTHISSLYLQVSKWSCWFRQIINLCLPVKQACSGAVPSRALNAGSQITLPGPVVWKISQTPWYLFRFMNSDWQKSTATVVRIN